MFAIIETGGKQYKVAPGMKIKVEKVATSVDNKILFDKVLLRADKEVEVGTPYLKGAIVEGRVVAQSRGKKKIVFHYRSKTRYKKFKTHRQFYTQVEIIKV
jgi:large subunit ribosomal protein L21